MIYIYTIYKMYIYIYKSIYNIFLHVILELQVDISLIFFILLYFAKPHDNADFPILFLHSNT